MSRYQTPSQRILTWLKNNGMKLAALTSTDTRALRASVEIAELAASTGVAAVAEPWGLIVRQMQPHTRYLAFHGVAMALDWGFRWEFWRLARFDAGELAGIPECKYGPQRKAL